MAGSRWCIAPQESREPELRVAFRSCGPKRRWTRRALAALGAGDPDDSPLRWTSKSLAKLTVELQAMGHTVSARVVSALLHDLGYTLQANRKTQEGSAHPDRDAQFTYLNDQVCDHQAQGYPVISVDTKKKELVGDFKKPGREWRPKGEPERVKVHDFIVPAQGKAIPY